MTLDEGEKAPILPEYRRLAWSERREGGIGVVMQVGDIASPFPGLTLFHGLQRFRESRTLEVIVHQLDEFRGLHASRELRDTFRFERTAMTVQEPRRVEALDPGGEARLIVGVAKVLVEQDPG